MISLPLANSTVQVDSSEISVKDDVHSVLRISSAHNKEGPPDIKIAQILLTSIANQKSVRYSVSISYFTNIAVQNVNNVINMQPCNK
jgi:hypothetical protein